MSIAKGKVYVTKERLAEIFGLPEGVEIIAVRPKELDDAFEFLVVSAEETPITRKDIPVGQVRRVSVDNIKEKGYIYGGLANTDGLAILGKQETILNKEQTQMLFETAEKVTDVFKTKGQASLNTDGVNITINSVIKQEEKDVQTIFEEIVKGLRKKGV